MLRSCITCFLLGSTILVLAQGLEGDFNALSAKERSRIAKAEEEGASKDAQYQAIMAQAESLFREQRFDEALEQFIQARDLRPYNVYPRVKIQDLQALIARRDAEHAEPQVPAAVEPSQPEPSVAPSRTVMEAPSPSIPLPGLPAMERIPVAPDHPPLERTSPPSGPLHAADPAEGGERIYKEGRAVVVERTIVQEGRPVVFRKVTHPWGEVMYFKDGSAIPERVWQETFGSR